MALTVQVPASTTNLGPGFDCLGVALQLWNRLRLKPGESDAQNPAIVSEAANLFFGQTGTKRFAFRCVIEGDVPQARGLGSSVTLRAGVLLALDELAASSLTNLTRIVDLLSSEVLQTASSAMQRSASAKPRSQSRF